MILGLALVSGNEKGGHEGRPFYLLATAGTSGRLVFLLAFGLYRRDLICLACC